MRRWILRFILGWFLFLPAVTAGETIAQVRISPTPIPAIIPTLTALPTQLAIATATPTWTATPEAEIMLEVRSDVGEVNVRQEPDPGSQRLGVIKSGEKFAVLGRYFRWLQFAYPRSPDGRGWVFEDLVSVIGDAAAIPNVDPYSEPSATPNAADIAFAETLAAVTLTPGADLTLNAQQRILSIPTPGITGTVAEAVGTLPTFTPPAEAIPLNARASSSSGAETGANTGVLEEALQQVASGNIPPIVPIALLAVGGILGLLVSSLRR